jgi:hypothetical protein
MKKIFVVGAFLIAGLWQANTASAQLSNILNQVVSATTAATSGSESSSLISNLIASVTGDLTTTQANLVGTWSYSAPCVQFESENALSKAGGTVIAEKVESKLDKIYTKVGIKSGTLTFTFDESGSCTYGIGSNLREGTYTFDSDKKMVTITTSLGRQVNAYVSISGSNMGLTFDASKMLVLFQSVSSKMTSLATISTIAGQYNGMKVGFEFTKSK